jgi:outer membrane protein assembly factor BamD (BamD/ComL family)
MISLAFDFRNLGTLSIVIALAGLSLRLQEQKYRERQVLDPNTNEWIEQEAPAEGAPGNDLDQARADLARNRPSRARTLLNRWLKQNAEDERTYEATFLLGETYFETRDFWKAVKQYTLVAENTSGELFERANERTVDVSRAFLAGQKRIVWGFLRLPAYAEAVDLLDRVWERVPGTRLGELALKLKADYYFNNGDLDLAQDEYANLAKQYPSGRYVEFAMLRAAEAAEAAFPGIKFDATPLVEADERYRQVQSAFPTYAERENVPDRLQGIREQRAEKDLDIAQWYARTRQPSAAEFYYRQVLEDWPDTLAAADARTRLRAMGARLEDLEPEGATP